MMLSNELVRMQKEAIMAVPYVAISAFAGGKTTKNLRGTMKEPSSKQEAQQMCWNKKILATNVE
jgi:hypothetical protein